MTYLNLALIAHAVENNLTAEDVQQEFARENLSNEEAVAVLAALIPQVYHAMPREGLELVLETIKLY